MVKNLRLFVLMTLFTCLLAQSVYAFEFKSVTFVGGTLYKEQKAKFISLDDKADSPLRIYVSSDGQVEFIDKKNNNTIKLFNDKIENPLLVYRLEAKKPNAVFYAVFDRSVRHDMKTDNFVLLGTTDKKNYSILTDLPDLQKNGWTSEGLQLRIEKKQLVIEGIIRDKSNPDNQVQPFLLIYDKQTQKTSFFNQKAQIDAEDLPKALKEEGEFILAGFQPGDNISVVTEKFGESFVVRNELVEDSIDDADEDEVDEAQKEAEQLFASHIYDKRLEFCYEKARGEVYAIYTTSGNFATKRGLTVDMSFKEMVEKYGRNYKRTRSPDAVINYIYSMKKQHPESSDLRQIGFSVNPKGKIIIIFVDQWSKLVQ